MANINYTRWQELFVLVNLNLKIIYHLSEPIYYNFEVNNDLLLCKCDDLFALCKQISLYFQFISADLLLSQGCQNSCYCSQFILN